MIRYYFVSIDGEVFVNLPRLVTDQTILSIMKDCGFSKCFVYIHGVKVFKDFSS